MTRPPHPLHGRHELLWEGKYDAKGLRNPPDFDPRGMSLHRVESYPPVVAPSESAQPGAPSTHWHDRLIFGDNRDALACLLPELKGKVQLVYLDPPFGSEADYRMNEVQQSKRTPGGKGALAYRDRWGANGASYLQFMAERLALMRELLTPSGCLFLHCDWHSVASLRLLLDELFGTEHFVNEIVWYYYNKYSRGRHCLPRAHDTILVYGRTRAPTLYPLRFLRDAPRRQLMRRNVDGVLRNARDASGKLMYQVVHDKKADDVWTIPQLQPASREWTGYATQKHPLLLERILTLGSKPGDLVADFFCGSGTTLTVAQRMGRRFLGGDLGATALHITRRRLIDAAERPGLDVFRVVGRARPKQAWMAKRLRAAMQGPRSRPLDMDIHIHAGPRPLQARQAAAKARTGKGRLICCAWEFEPGFWDRLAREKGAAAALPVLLPKDWLHHGEASEAEARVLPRVVAAAKRGANGSTRIRLVGWVEPDLSVVFKDAALEGAIGKPTSSRVDAWAVDADWLPDRPFTAAWSAVRPRRGTLPTVSPAFAPGPSRKRTGGVLVLAWDALGTEASTWIDVAPAP